MGMFMSVMGKGLPSTQMFNLLMGTLYKQFTEKEINTFEDFHQAFLDIFNTVNSALPGKHYDAPSLKDVAECYDRWAQSHRSQRKDVFVDFMKKMMNLSTLDDATMITGIVTPPAAMAAKKAGENVPQMRIIKAIPDVIFVPSVTLIALITAKLSRKIIQKKRSSYPPSPTPSIVPEASPPEPHFTSPPPSPPPSPLNQPSRPTKEDQPSRPTRERPPPSPQNQPSRPTRERPPPSPQKQPSGPTKTPSWTWYSPAPQPGFPRTRKPQSQDSSTPPSRRPSFPETT